MRFQCEACERLVPLEVFRVEAGVLVVTCDRCGAESRARAPSSTAGATSAAVGSTSMPPSQRSGLEQGTSPMPPAQRGGLGQAATSVPLTQRTGEGQGATPVPAAQRGGAVQGTDVSPTGTPPPPARASSPALRVVRTEAGGSGTAPLSAATLFEPPPGFCPKCVAPRREGAESCGQCGLVYVNFVADEHFPSEALAGAWRALAERWEDWEAHDRLMTLALGRGELAMLGRLYRLRLAWAPADPVAKRGLEEVVRRATLVVPSTPESSEQSLAQKRLKTVGVAVLFLVVLVLAVFIFQNLRELMAGP